MALFDIFRRKPSTAETAKDRLQIIVARERTATNDRAPDYLPALQQELLQVIAKYERVDMDQVSVNLDKEDGAEVLELNIVLPDSVSQKKRAVGS